MRHSKKYRGMPWTFDATVENALREARLRLEDAHRIRRAPNNSNSYNDFLYSWGLAGLIVFVLYLVN